MTGASASPTASVVLRTEPASGLGHTATTDLRDEIFGIECRHHYGITTHPMPSHGDAGCEVYRLIREAWYAPQDGRGLHDDDHSHEVVLSGEIGGWSRIVIRKNERSPRFVFKPWWCEDGPGALWFSQEFRVANRASIDREIADKLEWVATWERSAERQRDSIRGRKARKKYESLARSATVEARLIRSRWPQYDGTQRTGWQRRLHRHGDNSIAQGPSA